MTNNDQNYDQLKVEEYDYWTLYLHGAQNYLGRCYVALNRSGTLDPFIDTTPQEKKELEAIILKVQNALNKLYKPDLYNYANFRNTWPHCHWHIIPRYQEHRFIEGHEFIDNNWGKNYAPYDRDFKVPSKLLKSIKDDLRRELHVKIKLYGI